MTIFLGAIAQNLGDRIPNFQLFVNEFLEALPESHVYLYENNSTDGVTKQRLSAWTHPRLHVRSEDIADSFLLEMGKATTYDNKPCRMEKIACARNQLMKMMEADGMGLDPKDLTIIFDPDIPSPMSPDVLIHFCRNFPDDMDAMFANGKSQRGNYYDASAYYDQYNPFGLELLSEKFIFGRKYKSVIFNIPPSFPPIPVYSAFGGIGIYRSQCIRGLRYQGYVTKDVHDLFLRIKKSGHPWISEFPKEPVTHIEGAQQGIYLFDKELFYRNNSGYNYPVICEHVPFHAAMIARGYSRLFVMPSLVYISDHWE